MSKIKTLDEILAGMGKSVPADSSPSTQKEKTTKDHIALKNKNQSKNTKKIIKKSLTKTANPSGNSTINCQISINNDHLSKILATIDSEPLVENNKKTNRLRWLAFYYLSRRELSQKELRQKLLDKDQDPKMVEELLVEFAKKGYQSDERCTYMLIREALRKGRGKQYILQSFYKHGISPQLPLDELIRRADIDSLTDGTVLENPDNHQNQENIDWRKLAIEARTKKYGNFIPKDPKEKARQLRFLQYRGFSMDISLEALTMTLEDLDDM